MKPETTSALNIFFAKNFNADFIINGKKLGAFAFDFVGA